MSLPHLGESQLIDIVTLSRIVKEKVQSFLSGEEAKGMVDCGWKLELYPKVQARLVVFSAENRDAAISVEAKEEPAAVTQQARTTDEMVPIPMQKEAPHFDPLLRKEFRIKGQISEVGQKDKLFLSSLVQQINRGVAKGYAEEEVVDAIINAMVPSLTLRSYLECKPELDLPVLRRLLRSHYKEKEATELYHDLTGGSTRSQRKLSGVPSPNACLALENLVCIKGSRCHLQV